MNINSMVNQNYMMRGFTASNRKDNVDTTESKNTFEEKLHTFRQDNAFAKLEVKTKETEPDEKTPKDSSNVLAFSELLFDQWDSNLTAEDALAKLDQNLTKINSKSTDPKPDVREVLEHIAAQYAVYKQHISATDDGTQLNNLNKLIERHTEQYAKDFSESVGGFFEANGIEGESDRIYDDIMENAHSWVKTYDRFASAPGNNFHVLINDAHQNRKSLSNELRKTARENGISTTPIGIECYTTSTLSKAAKLMKFSTESLHIGNAQITNEEELGIQLGKAALQAHEFFYNLDNDDMLGYKDAFLLSVRKQLDQHLDKVDNMLAGKATHYLEANPTKTETPYGALDRDAVYAVVEAMTTEYEKNFSLSEAIDVGYEHGLQQYLSKVNSEGLSERYQDSSFWQGFVKMATDPRSQPKQQYLWVRRLLSGGTNSWLNAIA